ncbi:hypothetical protein Tco_1564864, partial [Tanacetum coccineum]
GLEYGRYGVSKVLDMTYRGFLGILFPSWSLVSARDQDDPHDDAPPEGENSAKRQKTSRYEAHMTGESYGQVNESKQNPSS